MKKTHNHSHKHTIRNFAVVLCAFLLALHFPLVHSEAQSPITGLAGSSESVASENTGYSAPSKDVTASPEPSYDVPVNAEPSYDAPANTEPINDVPVNDNPSYDMPSYDAPTSDFPEYDEPIHEPIVAPDTPEVQNPPIETKPKPYTPPKKKGVPIDKMPSDAVFTDAPYINQRSSFPNGCEAVSTVMLLQYLGIDITPKDFIYTYLDRGRSPYIVNGQWYACDPREQYPGDPANSSGWGCYPEVIKKAIDSLAPEGFEAFVLKDTPLSTLCKEYLDNGIPVVFWGTIDMKAPRTHVTWNIIDTDKTHTWITPFHCLLLVGYDSEGYYFNDPWQDKLMHYSRKDVEIAYSGIGREALVVLKED